MNVLEKDIINHFKRDYKKEVKNKEEIVLGLRPEDIQIVNPGEGIFDARLNMIGSLGSEAIVYLNIDEHEILAKVTGKINFKENDNVGLNFKEEDLFVFNKDNGKRLE